MTKKDFELIGRAVGIAAWEAGFRVHQLNELLYQFDKAFVGDEKYIPERFGVYVWDVYRIEQAKDGN